jgi:hypothetical protein
MSVTFDVDYSKMPYKAEKGKKKVKIENDDGDLYLYTTRNGYQWSAYSVDEELLIMVKDVIDNYLKENHGRITEEN